jgi:hypothetical protein
MIFDLKIFLSAVGSAALIFQTPAHAFVPTRFGASRSSSLFSSKVDTDIDQRTGKRTGTSYLPEEAIERAKVGNPIEKSKIAKDGTSAFVDVYEYARKIREGEMTWEEVEKFDLDSVSSNEDCFVCSEFPFFLHRTSLMIHVHLYLFRENLYSASSMSVCCIVANEHRVNS